MTPKEARNALALWLNKIYDKHGLRIRLLRLYLNEEQYNLIHEAILEWYDEHNIARPTMNDEYFYLHFKGIPIYKK